MELLKYVQKKLDILLVFSLSINSSDYYFSAISWWSVLLVEETKVLPRENHQPASSHRQILSHTVVSTHISVLELTI
jgi:hypothetical protein